MNKNKHYLISDASRQVQVEAHVLRYWEDELGLPIPRNELGHRYYTEFHIQLFRQIKHLKEQGYQLKAIRSSHEHTVFLAVPADLQAAAQQLDLNLILRMPCQNGCNGNRAGTRSTCHRFAGSALPDTHFYVCAVNDLDKFFIRSSIVSSAWNVKS